MTDTRLILHVKGTEETTTLPKSVVRAAIAQGQITRSQLIWSPVHNQWKQVRELPHLWPSQQLAPMPPARAVAPVQPKAVGVPLTQNDAPVRQASVAAPVSQPAARPVDYRIAQNEGGIGMLRWLCIFLGFIILGTVAGNYFLVDQPLVARLAETHFSNVTVYAHLGAYVQPGALIIHVPPSPAITRDNLIDVMSALAKSTPDSPLQHNIFDTVSLTSGWKSQYTITGDAWKQFGEMAPDDVEQRKEFLMDQISDASGEALVPAGDATDEASQHTSAERAWTLFASHFAP